MEAHTHARQQSEDKKIRVRIYGHWYPATVVEHENDKLEYLLDEPVVLKFERKPLFGIIPRRPLEFPYLPKGHRRTINTKYKSDRLVFQ
ncbi:MAG TPA: hypothetical protein VMU25_03205 [Candidatus Paceibacterota bacterium]|nr:hypothetical protein [Candidatus Paceibacterota bacterium]